MFAGFPLMTRAWGGAGFRDDRVGRDDGRRHGARACVDRGRRGPRDSRRAALPAGGDGAVRRPGQCRLARIGPARPLVVRPDLRVEVDPQLLRDLGLETVPPRLVRPDRRRRRNCRRGSRRPDRGDRRCPGVRPARRAHRARDRLGAGVRGPRRARAGARGARHDAAVVLRHQRRRGGAGAARAPAAPDRGRARLARPI